MADFTNNDDTIDSRDIIERLTELEETEERETWEDEELELLQDLNTRGEDRFSEWPYGVTLIRDSFFEEYAQELAVDVGAITNENHWPANCIDWSYAAEQLQVDYAIIDFDGVEYWGR